MAGDVETYEIFISDPMDVVYSIYCRKETTLYALNRWVSTQFGVDPRELCVLYNNKICSANRIGDIPGFTESSRPLLRFVM